MRIIYSFFLVFVHSFVALSVLPSMGCTSDFEGDEEELYEDDSPDTPSCTPDCTNKTCGDDGCGGDCGFCATRLCEENECVDGECVYTPMTDQALTCDGFELTYCEDSEWNYLWCPDACREAGYNTVYGCGVSGADPEGCNCGTIDDTCPQDMEMCISGTELFGCIASENFYYQLDCEGGCKSLGHAGAAGCVNDRCACYDVDANNNLCLPQGEYCDGSTNLFCCPGNVCSYNGSVYTCQESTPCPDQCWSPGGEVCCGGALCSGDCVGNPCCD